MNFQTSNVKQTNVTFDDFRFTLDVMCFNFKIGLPQCLETSYLKTLFECNLYLSK
ncbi:MAG: hypothetical protein ACTS45_01050 [Candidatus Hodgkinia cicadicola]